MTTRRAPRLFWLFAAACLAFTLTTASAQADESPRDQARQHAQTGEARFKAQDYRGAIEAFRAADALVPSPILSYNIALAYEKLGDEGQAIQAYQEYLTRRPEAPNRAQIETRVKELGDKLAARQAAEAEAKAAAEAAAKAAAAQADQDLYREVDAPEPAEAPAVAATAPGQLAPANAVDEGLARRFPSRALANAVAGTVAPGAVTGPVAPGEVPPTPSVDAASPELAQASTSAAPPSGPAEQAPSPIGPPPSGPAPEQPAKDEPIYTKWWFWGVVVVGTVVVISAIANDGSDDGANRPPNTVGSPSGAVLFSF